MLISMRGIGSLLVKIPAIPRPVIPECFNRESIVFNIGFPPKTCGNDSLF